MQRNTTIEESKVVPYCQNEDNKVDSYAFFTDDLPECTTQPQDQKTEKVEKRMNKIENFLTAQKALLEEITAQDNEKYLETISQA